MTTTEQLKFYSVFWTSVNSRCTHCGLLAIDPVTPVHCTSHCKQSH